MNSESRMKPLFLMLTLIAFITLSLQGCTIAGKTGQLGPDQFTKTKIVSVFSKADLNDLEVDTGLTPTNYTSGTSLASASVDPETETLPVLAGMAQQANEFNQQMQMALISRMFPEDDPEPSEVDLKTIEALDRLSASQERIEAALTRLSGERADVPEIEGDRSASASDVEEPPVD